jgi:hypothetical protein
VRSLFFFAVVFLVLSLACAEIPELLTICDNTSNDFVVHASSSGRSSLRSPIKSVASTVRDTNSGSGICQFEPAFIPQVVPHTGRDLLILHCLQKN